MTVPFGENSKTFTQEDAKKTYSYTVEETKKGGQGYTNDSEKATVTIKTEDNGKGKLTVTTTMKKGTKEETVVVSNEDENPKSIVIPFVNSYSGDPAILDDGGDATINATKTLTGRDLNAGEFNFIVKDAKGKQVATGTNGADGKIDFTKIEYKISELDNDVTADIAEKEEDGLNYIYSYQYEVSEVKDNLPEGVEAITQPMSITVKVTDKGDGSLSLEVIYPEGAEGLVFENQYGADATAKISVSGKKTYKALSGDNKPDITGEYEFSISADDSNAPLPNNKTAKNDAAGNIIFGDIEYTIADAGKTYTYTVKESGDVTGVSIDGDKQFTVEVIDNGNGTITAKTDNGTEPLFRFDNKYSVDPIESSITDKIKIKKNLDGDRAMKAGEFQFELVERISEGDNVVDKVIDRATNGADGNVTFGAIKYDNVGTHEYTVREVNNGLGGITYDTNSYKIVTNVTDNGDGTLSVEHKRVATTEEEQKADIVFTNTYKATPASVALGAAKILKNGELKDGQFTFLLKDSKGDVVSEAKNDANGSIRFDAMEFDKAGTFEYTVSEVKGNDRDIKYDENEYKITVEVKDDGNGNMTAEITKGIENGIVFVNTAEAGAGTETGDNMPLAALAVVMMAATGAGIVTVRRKIKH